MNGQLEDTAVLATDLQIGGVDPVRAAYCAHLVVCHRLAVADATGLVDPRLHHQQQDHTELDHHHTEGP